MRLLLLWLVIHPTFAWAAGEPTVAVRDLKRGQRHTYPFSAQAGQFVRARLERLAGQMDVRLVGPDGRAVAAARGVHFHFNERLAVHAPRAGRYRLEVHSAAMSIVRYRLTWSVRDPAPEDATLLAAEARLHEGIRAVGPTAAGPIEPAVTLFAEAAARFQEASDEAGAAEALYERGLFQGLFGRTKDALETLEQARAAWKAAGDERGHAITVIQLGSTARKLGQTERAFALFAEAEPVLRALGATNDEGALYNVLGIAYNAAGETQKAMDAYARGLSLTKIPSVATLLRSNLGGVLDSLGKDREALAHFQRAAAEFGLAGARREQGWALLKAGVLLDQFGRTAPALATFDRARRTLAQAGDVAGVASVSQERGRVYTFLGRYAEARRDLEGSLEQWRGLRVPLSEEVVLRYLGILAASERRWDESETHLSAAYAIAREAGSAPKQRKDLLCLARTSIGRGRWAEAQPRIDEAIALSESLRTKVASPELRTSYQDSARSMYELQMNVRMQLHRIEPEAGHAAAALHSSETARARGLLELLREARLDLRAGVDPALLKEEERLSRVLHTEAPRDGRTERVDETLVALRDVQAHIRRASPRYAALAEPPILGLTQIQAGLPADVLLLEYAVGQARSYLWAVTSKGMDVFELPPRAALENDVRRFHRLLGARALAPAGETPAQRRDRLRRADRQLERTAARLTHMLLAPARPLLESRRLLVVPDGALHYLSFAALPDPAGDGSRCLVEAHDISYAPSVSVAASLAAEGVREHAAGDVLVLADPVFDHGDARVSAFSCRRVPSKGPLPRLGFSRQEAQAIVGASPRRVRALLDFDAGREVVFGDEPSRHRILHLATHAVLDTKRPELSGLALSLVGPDGRERNGWLRAVDLYSLQLPVEMVVLSGCQTALGQEVRSEGLVGLTRGFFHAGARRVLSSLWRVDDRATAELMKELYTRLLGPEPADPARVLAEAQRAVARNPRFQHPFYWSAFVLQGSWS